MSAVRGARAAQGQPGTAHPQHAWPTSDGLLVQVIAKSCQHMRATWSNSGAIDSCDFWRGQCQKSVDFNSSAASPCGGLFLHAGGSTAKVNLQMVLPFGHFFLTRALIFFPARSKRRVQRVLAVCYLHRA